jgi:hypothetical protein
VSTRLGNRDRGVRFCDLDGDGICELIVGNSEQPAVYQWLAASHVWKRLPFTLPDGTALVDAQGHDAGCRLVDIDEDGHPDVVFSNADRCSLHLFRSMSDGWSRKIWAVARSDGNRIPMIVRADGTNNGVWFKYAHLWAQNEDTGETIQLDGKQIRIPVEGHTYRSLLDGDPRPSAGTQ